MKLEDSIYRSVLAYPSLYLKQTWQESRLSVLHQYFLVLGNGMVWAVGKNGKQEGYLTHSSHYKRNGDWIRKIDPPYGKPTIKNKLSFEEIWGYYITTEIDNIEEDRHGFWKDKNAEDLRKLVHQRILEKDFYSLGELRENPYPFSENHWPFSKIDPKLIKPDWRAGMIEIKEWVLLYFKDKEKYGQDYYFGWTDRSVKNQEESIKKYHPNLSWKEILVQWGNVPDCPEWDWKQFTYLHREKNRLNYVEQLENALDILKSI